MEDDTSPVTGSKVVIAESGAIMDYIVSVYGNGRLARTLKDGAEYAPYLEWFHFANGSLQPTLFRVMMAKGPASDPKSPIVARTVAKWTHLLDMMEARLGETGAYLAGKELTAADVMNIFTLTTMRGFFPVELDTVKNKNILAYLKRVGERPAYQKAMRKCEGENFRPVLGSKAEVFDIMKPKI
jgi:Glutathione S-transferase